MNGNRMSSTVLATQALRKQRGFSFVELGIVLLIIGVLVGVGVPVGLSLMKSAAVSTETSRITNLNAKLAGYAANSADTSQISSAMAIANEWVAPDSVSGTTITHKLGGVVTITPATLVSANDAYAINYSTLKALPQCSAFVKNNAGGFDQVVVNGTTVKATTSTTLNEASLATACAASNTIVFTKAKT